MQATAVTAAFLLTFLPTAASPAPPAVLGGWTVGGNLSTQRPGSLLSIALTDGSVLIAGASGGDGSGIGNVDIFDPAHGWTRGPNLNGDPLGAAGAPLPGGGALLAGGTPWFGGFDGPGPDPTASVLTYDPASRTWSTAPNMSSPRNGATATPLRDGRVLIAGGYYRIVKQLPNPNNQPFCCLEIDFIPLPTAEIFDPSARRWSPTGSLAQARFGDYAVALKSGQVLVVAGSQQPNSKTQLTSAERYDPATGRWSSAGDIGAPRTGFTLTALADGRALLAGGLAADGATLLRTALIYDPVSNAWSSAPDMKDARTNHAAAALKDGRVLVAGGIDNLGRLAASEVFDPVAGTWTSTGALQTARSDEAAVALADGRVIVAGGNGSMGALADSEIFDPSSRGGPPQPRSVAGPGRWVTLPAPPASTYQQTPRLLRDGRVLVVPGGGYAEFTAEVYDPKAGRWTTPVVRRSDQSSITGVALADDRLLLLTLANDGQSPGKAEIVDLTTGASNAVASPGSVGGARLDLLADGRVWLTGGIIMGPRHSLFYDPKTDRWSPAPDLPADLDVETVTPIQGGRVLVGGYLQAMILDPATSAWTRVATFPLRWSSYSATLLPGGDVLFAGGMLDQVVSDQRTVPVGTTRVMRWDHVTGIFATESPMPAARPFASTVVLKDGRVLFAGGTNGTAVDSQTDPVATAELYDPAKDRWSPAQSMPEARAQASAVLLADGTVLEVGGYGMLNPSPNTLAYSPETPPSSAKPVAAVSGQPQAAALIAGLVIVVAGALVSWLLVASARRRRRSGR